MLTLERPDEQPFALEDIESLRLTGDLVTARLVGLHETRPLVRRQVRRRHRARGWPRPSAPSTPGSTSGDRRLRGLIGFLVFAKGTYRVQAPFTIQAIERRLVAAPFDGQLPRRCTSPGDVVKAGRTVGPARDEGTEARAGKEAA